MSFKEILMSRCVIGLLQKQSDEIAPDREGLCPVLSEKAALSGKAAIWKSHGMEGLPENG